MKHSGLRSHCNFPELTLRHVAHLEFLISLRFLETGATLAIEDGVTGPGDPTTAD